MTGEHDDRENRDELTTTAMDWALGERLGGEVPPDLRDRLHALLASAAAPPVRRSPWLLAAAALFGVGVVAAVAVLARPAPKQQAQEPVRAPVRDEKPQPVPVPVPQEPATVSSAKEIEALSADTKAVLGIGIEDEEVRALLRLTSLERLELRAVQPSPMTPGKPAMPLNTLGDDGLLLLTSLKSLRRLTLVNQTALTKRGFAALGQLPQLTDLTIDCSGAWDDDLAALSSLPRLESLALHNLWNIHQPTIERIAGIRSLRVLDLSHNGLLETAWLKPLGSMADLLELRLASVGFTNVDVSFGPDVRPTANYVSAITDELIDSFRGLRSLRTLDVTASSLTAAGRQRLQALLPQATILDTTITPGPLVPGPERVSSRAEIERLPVMTSEVIGEGLSDDAIPSLLRLRKLETLELSASIRFSSPPLGSTTIQLSEIPQITDDAFLKVAALKSLRALRLKGRNALTKRSMDSLAGFPDLTELSICSSSCDDNAFASLSQLPRLEHLELRGCPYIGKPTIERIAAITSLRVLDLGDNPQLEAGWLRLLGGMTALVELRLSKVGFAVSSKEEIRLLQTPDRHFGSAVTDELIDSFARLRSLRTLDISYSDLTPAGKQRLQALLPDLRIVDTTPSSGR
ncbi:MAG: hypothetical protein U1E73_05650 [Planctomycetota bacterium]